MYVANVYRFLSHKETPYYIKSLTYPRLLRSDSFNQCENWVHNPHSSPLYPSPEMFQTTQIRTLKNTAEHPNLSAQDVEALFTLLAITCLALEVVKAHI